MAKEEVDLALQRVEHGLLGGDTARAVGARPVLHHVPPAGAGPRRFVEIARAVDNVLYDGGEAVHRAVPELEDRLAALDASALAELPHGVGCPRRDPLLLVAVDDGIGVAVDEVGDRIAAHVMAPVCWSGRADPAAM